ncbi:TPA: GvpL/GvpF family gas vesicle protein [Methanosarcinaceae archaeon]|nr:GvpL/GvpF family gas vesicle protein [Methanosarcinaceae archaeon]
MSKNNEGRYLYSVLNRGIDAEFAETGVNSARVYTVIYRDLTAVVHACSDSPGLAAGEGEAMEWILEHIRVVDLMTEKFGTVVPFTFGTIIKGDDEVVSEWLRENYAALKAEISRFEGRAEYSIQIFYEQELLSGEIFKMNPGLQELKGKLTGIPRGIAYLFERQLEHKIAEEIEALISGLAAGYEARIRDCSDSVLSEEKKPGVPEEYEQKKLFVFLACLVQDGKVPELGELLDRINEREGICVRFIGPFAPFSFVRLKGI